MKIGVDIVEVARMEKLLRHPHFLEKVFTAEERAHIEAHRRSPGVIAGLFAAKEAVAKALGSGIGRLGFHDLYVLHDASGAPSVRFSARGKAMLRERGLSSVQLSISHERLFAVASAIGIASDSGRCGRRLPLSPELSQALLKRDVHGYKSQYGRVAVIGGSSGMAGSVCLAAQAALRTGAGLVYAVVPKSLADTVQIKLNEVIVRSVEDGGAGHFTRSSVDGVLRAVRDCDCIAVGPGLGRAPELAEWLRAILSQLEKPVIVDADALYAAARDPKMLSLCAGRCAITPHEMEMSRLTQLPVEKIRADRPGVAMGFASRYNIDVILKGAGTVITNGAIYYLNSTGNPGMATAGAGDVLTGILAAFGGYGYPWMLALRLGCYVHGLAGDLARDEKGENGLIAGDLIEFLPYGLKMLQEHTGDEYEELPYRQSDGHSK